MQLYKNQVNYTASDVSREAGLHRSNVKSQTKVLISHKKDYFSNSKQRPTYDNNFCASLFMNMLN